MKKSHIVILAISALLFMVTVFIVGGMIVLNIVQEKKLNIEAEKIASMDISQDTVDMDIKTKGNYAVVEKTIKDYFNQFATLIQETTELMNDEEFLDIVTAQNFDKDGPEFKKSFALLKETEKKFNANINSLQTISTKEHIKSLIKDKGLSDYYVDLYNTIMLENMETDAFTNMQDSLKSVKNEMKLYIETSTDTLEFLKENKDYWYIDEDDYIIFDNDDLLEQYNNIIKPFDNTYY